MLFPNFGQFSSWYCSNSILKHIKTWTSIVQILIHCVLFTHIVHYNIQEAFILYIWPNLIVSLSQNTHTLHAQFVYCESKCQVKIDLLQFLYALVLWFTKYMQGHQWFPLFLSEFGSFSKKKIILNVCSNSEFSN